MSAASNSCRGFTLLEALVVVAIAAIFSAMALPAFGNLIASMRIRNAASDLTASLMLARSEAIKRGATVNVTPSASGWAGGWSVKSGTTVLETRDALGGVDVTANATGSIGYQLDGRNGSTIRSVTFYSSTRSSIDAQCVLISASGRPSVRSDSDGDASNGCN